MSQQNPAGQHLTSVTTAWATMATNLVQGATAANRAAVSAMFPATSDGNGTEPTEDLPPSIPSVEYERLGWEFERTVDDPAHISVGDTVTFSKPLTDDDVRHFAALSGDTNRLHLNDEYAADTRFGERIVHGTLVSGLISAALARLPGLTIYLSQDLEFRAPVSIGDRVSARVEIVEDLGNEQYRLETQIHDEDEDVMVIDGEAVVLIDEPPE